MTEKMEKLSNENMAVANPKGEEGDVETNQRRQKPNLRQSSPEENDEASNTDDASSSEEDQQTKKKKSAKKDKRQRKKRRKAHSPHHSGKNTVAPMITIYLVNRFSFVQFRLLFTDTPADNSERNEKKKAKKKKKKKKSRHSKKSRTKSFSSSDNCIKSKDEDPKRKKMDSKLPASSKESIPSNDSIQTSISTSSNFSNNTERNSANDIAKIAAIHPIACLNTLPTSMVTKPTESKPPNHDGNVPELSQSNTDIQQITNQSQSIRNNVTITDNINHSIFNSSVDISITADKSQETNEKEEGEEEEMRGPNFLENDWERRGTNNHH